jgi:transposase
MAMGREGNRQDDLIVTWAEMPRSPGHVFYDRLQEVLIAGGFGLFVETACQPYLRAEDGRTVSASGALFPDAHGWLFRGHRQ